MLPTALEIILRAARTAKRGGSLCATTAQSITQWDCAVNAPSPPSRRVGYLTTSLWLRRPAAACGGLRGCLPATGATVRLLTRSFGAAFAGRDLARCWLPAGLLLGGLSLPVEAGGVAIIVGRGNDNVSSEPRPG